MTDFCDGPSTGTVYENIKVSKRNVVSRELEINFMEMTACFGKYLCISSTFPLLSMH